MFVIESQLIMKHFLKLFLLQLVIVSTTIFAQNSNVQLEFEFTQWLQDNSLRTDQTSGIAILKSSNDTSYFLIADDIGEIHRLLLFEDKVQIHKIILSKEVNEFLEDFPKKDFEEIVFDKHSGKIYLSMEGNGENYREFVGIYELVFKNNDPYADSLIAITKINFKPAQEFLEFTSNNIGYEGLAVDENFFYLGLEGFVKDYRFADSAYIYIADKFSLNILKKISTEEFGIHTICGLYSDSNFSIWGIDRNQREIFHLVFTENFEVSSIQKYPFSSVIPGYTQFTYVGSFESITMDDNNNLYLIDDPWKQVFIPPQEVLEKLDDETKQNFKSLIPIIIKFKMKGNTH